MEIYVFTWITAFLEQQQKKIWSKIIKPKDYFTFCLRYKSFVGVFECSFHLNQCQILLNPCWVLSQNFSGKNVLVLERIELLSHETLNGKIKWFSVFMLNSTLLSSISWDYLDYCCWNLCLWYNFQESLSV